MTGTDTETRSVVIEEDLPHPPEKVWRALTEQHLIEDWLMKNDFVPNVGHQFKLTADWGAVDCKVLAMEPNRMISYTWEAYGLESVVTWTLTPTDSGTHLKMEQSGFRRDQAQAYGGARSGWKAFFTKLGETLGRMD